MARFHRATITPTKDELIAAWVPTRPWGPAADADIEVIGSYRVDDPDGQVGMENFLVRAGGDVLHVPLTYRDAPLDSEGATLVGVLEHSVLGTRYVYDGVSDPRAVTMLAAVTMTGQGEALGMAVYEDRWYVAPTNVRIAGGGWTLERVPLDRFDLVAEDGDAAVLRNDRFELTVWRRPAAGERPALALAASWDGGGPLVVAAVRDLGA